MKSFSDYKKIIRVIALSSAVLFLFVSPFSFAAEEAKYSKNISFSVLLDEEAAKAIMEKHAPALMSNPDIDMARGMSLGEVASFPEAGLSNEIVEKILADLNQLEG
ncbi:hypothetical protein NBRC116493_03120 [Aurantivibrio infirmus]